MSDSNDDRDYLLTIVAALIIGCLTFRHNASGIAVTSTRAATSSTEHGAGKRRMVIVHDVRAMARRTLNRQIALHQDFGDITRGPSVAEVTAARPMITE